MRALQVQTEDGPEAIEVVDLPEPDGELVVQVRAAAVSFPDLLMTRGEYQVRQPLPFTLGWEAAGDVIRAPAGGPFAVGDRVMSLTFGAHAEQLAAPVESTFPLPERLTYEEGAALPLNYLTAVAALDRRGHLQAGESVLVHGAAGGVGTATIQVAKASGAKVIAVVSNDDKERVAREAGADEVVRSDGSWKDEAKEISGGGVNLVFDPVGGDRFTDSIRSLTDEGRVVVIGFTEGSIPEVAVNRLLLRNVSVVGAGWGAYAIPRPDYARATQEDLDRMAREGFVKPIIGKTYGFDEIPQALKDIDERRALGKLVLNIP